MRVLVLAALTCVLTASSSIAAQFTQEEVFRSINTNVGGEHNSGNGKGFVILLSAVAALMIIMLIGSRLNRRQPVARRTLDHPGKLLREVMKSVPLSAKEMKVLTELAEASQASSSSDSVQSPLTFLLCPSVLGRTIKNHPAKVDRVVLTQIVRKMGAQTPAR